MQRLHRHHVIGLAAVAAATAMASGVTYAATMTLPASVKACENGAGTLRLRTSSGSCPSGYTAITIGKTGPRGPRGYTGARGPVGPAGPGAISLLAASTTATSDFHDSPLPGFGLTVRTICAPNAQSSVYLMDDDPAAGPVEVRGTAVRAAGGAASVVWNDGTVQNTAIPSGTSLQSYQHVPSSTGAAFEFIDTAGDLDLDVVVARAGSTFTLTAYAIQSPSACRVQGQATPSG